jgi:transcriptional regulator with XRE-family HTH domain
MAIDQIPPLIRARADAGFPELTDLGKRVEMLRIGCGLSKQHLARHAGISRQQLWRVMTGKSELTTSLCTRLADALQVDTSELAVHRWATHPDAIAQFEPAAADLKSYLDDPSAVVRTLSSLPAGDAGRLLKRDLLNSIEERAIKHGHILGPQFFELRRRVLAGEL